jgi:hypothetical protein
VGIFEVATIDGDLKEAIFNGKSQDDLDRILRSMEPSVSLPMLCPKSVKDEPVLPKQFRFDG